MLYGLQRALGREISKLELHLSYWERGRVFGLEKGPGRGHRFSQRGKIPRTGPCSPQDPSRKRNIHHRIPQKRDQTVCREKNPDDMHAQQASEWRRSTLKDNRRADSRRLARDLMEGPPMFAGLLAIGFGYTESIFPRLLLASLSNQ